MNDIVKILYEKGCIREECNKLCKRADLIDDLTHEVTLAMMEKSPELIEQLNGNGKILGYIYKIAQYQYNSKTSKFYKQYKRHEKENTELRLETI